MRRFLPLAIAALLLGLAYWQFGTTTNNGVSAETSTDIQTAAAVKKPKILLMTSLPIIWGEAASMENILSGEAAPAAIYRHWQESYHIEAVDSLSGLTRPGTDLVILAQPRAMDPADLADLDAWIGRGGRALIFTDPMLSWPSDLPIGDRRRPLMSGLLSPLLDRWELQLRVPEGPAAGNVELQFEGLSVATAGIGSLHSSGRRTAEQATCDFSKANLIARCRVANGRVILVADADFLDERLWLEQNPLSNSKPSDVVQWIDKLISDLHIAG